MTPRKDRDGLFVKALSQQDYREAAAGRRRLRETVTDAG
jgi:hypothetical protein